MKAVPYVGIVLLVILLVIGMMYFVIRELKRRNKRHREQAWVDTQWTAFRRVTGSGRWTIGVERVWQGETFAHLELDSFPADADEFVLIDAEAAALVRAHQYNSSPNTREFRER